MNATQIRQLRSQVNLTQQDFASLLSLSFVSVNRWENAHAHATDLSLVLLTLLQRALHAHQSSEVIQRLRETGPAPIDLLRELFRMEAKS